MSEKTRVIMNGEDVELALRRIALQILEKNQDAEEMAIVGISYLWSLFSTSDCGHNTRDKRDRLFFRKPGYHTLS